MVALVRAALWRYGWQLLVLAVLALAPVLLVALRVAPPVDAATARTIVHLGPALIVLAVFGQLVLVAGASVLTRAIAGDAQLSQGRALVAGAIQLARALVPVAIAVVAIAIGALALAVPGLVLLVLLSLTAASPELGAPLPAPLTDSVATVHARFATVALALAITIAVDIAIVIVVQRFVAAPLSKSPAPQELASYRAFIRVAALALVAISPFPACTLAAIRTRA